MGTRGTSVGLVDGQALALALVQPEKAGMAAGFVNTLRLGSEAVAVAVYGSCSAPSSTAGTPTTRPSTAAVGARGRVCLVLGVLVARLLRAPPVTDGTTRRAGVNSPRPPAGSLTRNHDSSSTSATVAAPPANTSR
ncbi:hypothetical protein [Streptomyces sp. NPDC057636]|uniref:hypothetical protein n=1 Tax=Streptomyces sp. NPDC057636 TaxID=3346189 RepID=UPI003681D64B